MPYYWVNNCVPVEGYNRSGIYDLTRCKFELISNEVYEAIVNERFDLCDPDDLAYLEEKEYIFDVPKNAYANFSKFDTTNYQAATCTNLVLVLSRPILKMADKIAEIIDELLTTQLTLIVPDLSSINELNNFLTHFDNSFLDSIDLRLRYAQISLKELESWIAENNRVGNGYVFVSPELRALPSKRINHFGQQLFLTHSDLFSELHYDKNPAQFEVNFDLFLESVNGHMYFDRKVFISGVGEIKNAYELDEVYGQLSELSTTEIAAKVRSSEFQKYGTIKKEQCDVCAQCEFRHMCVDNRKPYQRGKGEWYFKEPCNLSLIHISEPTRPY